MVGLMKREISEQRLAFLKRRSRDPRMSLTKREFVEATFHLRPFRPGTTS
jgi:hypothetical protein